MDTGDTDTGVKDSDTAGSETGETGETAEPIACDRTLPWTFVDAGIQQTCGIHSDGCAECWGIGKEDDGPAWDTGAYQYQGEDRPPDYQFVTIDILRDRHYSVWAPHACGIVEDDSVVCWGNDRYGMSSPPAGVYTAVAVTANATWAAHADGTVAVWGFDTSTPALTSIRSVEGAYGVIAARSSGELSYWNESGNHEFAAPAEPFTAFDFGDVFGCGVNADGDIHCWELATPEKWETADLTLSAPAGPFVDVCVDWAASACGLRDDGTVTCWSEPYDSVDLSDVPEGYVYTQIACGWRHVCAVTVDGLIVCWGDDSYGETLVPT